MLACILLPEAVPHHSPVTTISLRTEVTFFSTFEKRHLGGDWFAKLRENNLVKRDLPAMVSAF